MNPCKCLVAEIFTSVAVVLIAASLLRADEVGRPNVLFIAIDDLNDWIGCLGGHSQAATPNLDRLARSSVLFTNAHCAAPACNPSRTAVFTGRSPNVSGLYENGQPMREVLPDVEIMTKTFSRHGYYAAGSGKLLHYFIDSPSWDDYFPKAADENPLPRTLYPKHRPLNLPRGGAWQYVETDWGSLDATNDEYGGDFLVSQWIGEQLKRKHAQPFFLACGIYRPHEPWFVPAKYFEPFPLDSIQLPPGYREDDLDDLPSEGKRRGPNRYFAHIQMEGRWKQAIQGYLASIHFADAMLGHVLEALEQGPNSSNTIVVLWSDHGWHLGEKQHWQKYTAWRVCTRVPLMIRVPAGAPGLSAGTSPSKCDKSVSLVSLFPTLLDLCGLTAETQHDGPSLVPLLRGPNVEWPHDAVTFLADPGSYSLSTQQWRLIHYANGDEELYDVLEDPYEWTNLASLPEHRSTLNALRTRGPQSFAEKKAPSIASLPALPWSSIADESPPPSRLDGGQFDVVFINQSEAAVRLVWIDPQGKQKHYADIASGAQKSQHTRPGAVWLITNDRSQSLGFFQVGDRKAKATIPAANSSKDNLK